MAAPVNYANGLMAYPPAATSHVAPPQQYQTPAGHMDQNVWDCQAQRPVVAQPDTQPIEAAVGSSGQTRSERGPRMSGGKRDHDTSEATDTVNPVPGSAPSLPPLAKQKPKITYTLPHQNMEEGHFYIVLGEDIDTTTKRFKILSLLGEGTFGKVVEAWDRKHREYCAVKIVRNTTKYTRDAEYEIRFMEKVRVHDATDSFPFVKIVRYFKNEGGHVCIVMRKYGPCLLTHLQKHGSFPHQHLARIIFQAGVALDGLHSEMRLMHTDLKPENILLESGETASDSATGRIVPASTKIRLCDLGGCCDERHSKSAIVSTRHYRSPEVILGLGWMFSTDLWSMGCIIYELATGRLLFDTHDNLEHLHLMEKTLGALPREWAVQATGDAAAQVYPSRNRDPAAPPERLPPLGCTLLRPLHDPKHIARVERAILVRSRIPDPKLVDLIVTLLSYDKRMRPTARQMTNHPYVRQYYPESVSHPLHPDNRKVATGTGHHLPAAPEW